MRILFYLLFIISIPFDETFFIKFGSLTVSVTDISILVLFMVMITSSIISRYRESIVKQMKVYFILLMLFASTLIISFFLNIETTSVRIILSLLEGFVIVVLSILSIRNDKDIKRVELAIISISIIACIFAILAAFGYYEWPTVSKLNNSGREIGEFLLPWMRRAGMYNNYSAFGSIAIVGLAISQVKLYSNSSKIFMRFLYFLISFIIFVGLMMTQSRSIFISCIVVICIPLITFFGKKAIIISVVALIALILLYHKEVYMLFFEISTITSGGRIEQYLNSGGLTAESPFFGSGAGYYTSQYHNSIHNIFLNILVSFGIFALLFFALLLMYPIYLRRTLFKSEIKNITNGLDWILVALIGQFVIFLFSSSISLINLWLMQGIFIALLNNNLNKKNYE